MGGAVPRLTHIAAVRGAISVPRNDAASIRIATSRLVQELIARNHLTPARIVSAIFTATPDLDADFPAHAARRLGWTDAPLLCATEIGVPGAPKRIVRVLVTVRDVPHGTKLTPVYLDEAVALRKDLAHPSDTAPPRAQKRVTIVGLGQIGGSIGLALGRNGRWQRTGFDARVAVARRALEARAIDEVALSLEAACADAQVIVLAAPVDVLPGLIERVASVARRGAVLLDTGSTRRGVTEALRAAAKRGLRACGGHPLAGSEGRGLAAARPDLFEGMPFVLLPTGAVPAPARTLVRDLGARALVVDPNTHDAALARTSHLPYVVARALARVGGAAAKRHLAGPGFASSTRLAKSDPRIALAFVRANAGNVRTAWRELQAAVERELKALPRR
jgi:prephenate dehydrogenase